MNCESSDLMDIESISSLSTSISTQPIHQENIDELVSYAENFNSEIKKREDDQKNHCGIILKNLASEKMDILMPNVIGATRFFLVVILLICTIILHYIA